MFRSINTGNKKLKKSKKRFIKVICNVTYMHDLFSRNLTASFYLASIHLKLNFTRASPFLNFLQGSSEVQSDFPARSVWQPSSMESPERLKLNVGSSMSALLRLHSCILLADSLITMHSKLCLPSASLRNSTNILGPIILVIALFTLLASSFALWLLTS